MVKLTIMGAKALIGKFRDQVFLAKFWVKMVKLVIKMVLEMVELRLRLLILQNYPGYPRKNEMFLQMSWKYTGSWSWLPPLNRPRSRHQTLEVRQHLRRLLT